MQIIYYFIYYLVNYQEQTIYNSKYILKNVSEL